MFRNCPYYAAAGGLAPRLFSSPSRRRTGILLVLLALAASPARGQTPTLTTLFNFDGAHGANPWYGSLTLSGTTLFGMTYGGGASSDGTVFSIPTSGGTPTVLLSFTDSSTSGGSPFGSLTLGGSTLYGMTYSGGSNGGGTAFSIATTGGAQTILYNFGAHQQGDHPYGDLTLSGSTLYGMTQTGGTSGFGTVFSLPTSGGTATILSNFDGTHGADPYGGVTLNGSTLYGMTYWGGTAQGALGYGTVFSLPLGGGSPAILAPFNSSASDGKYPYGSLTLIGSTLYGMTEYGGAYGMGEIFSIPTSGGTATPLHSFDGSDGEHPYGSLTLRGSTFYGTTSAGTGSAGDGTIFEINTDGTGFNTLYSFPTDDSKGANPQGTLTLSADGTTLYGMTHGGGANFSSDGTIFSLTVPAPTPEPSSLVLLGVAAAVGLLACARRRRNAA
ncbi:MAG: choice-of-anchor tandem repeat GloVer-containing protein [Thermoguttaceae bacterium]|jgi:uncharacterized repeat protein (TIGR03803 family)